MAPLKVMEPDAVYEGFRRELIAVHRSYQATLSQEEMLAVSSYLAGQMIAAQHPRELTPRRAMNIAKSGIQEGHDDLLNARFGDTKGTC